ncbi:MAG: hypothetical protein ACE5FT_04610, partial [Candidatus Nanoarchaeia archaeon]
MKDLPPSKLEKIADSAGTEVVASKEEAQLLADGDLWASLRGSVMGATIGPYALPTMLRRLYEAFKEPAWTKKAVSNVASGVSTGVTLFALHNMASGDPLLARDLPYLMGFYWALSAGYEANLHRVLGRMALDRAKAAGPIYLNFFKDTAQYCGRKLRLVPAQLPESN